MTTLSLVTKVAEDPSVKLPFMNCYDGFITSHSVENIELLEDDVVKKFVGEYNPEHALLKSPVAYGPFAHHTYHFETKRLQAEAMKNAKAALLKYSAEYEKLTGRHYDLFESYKLDDAEIAMVIIGSSAGTAKYVVDQLREKGVKAGLLKIRAFRPFPKEEIAEALKNVTAVAVIDRSSQLKSMQVHLYSSKYAVLFMILEKRPVAVDYIYGLGGRDVKTTDLESVYNDLAEIAAAGKTDNVYRYLGLAEE